MGSGTKTGGRMESGLYPAVIVTARIVNVNVRDWTVDAVGEYGNTRYMDIQMMHPYFHYAAGEGIYVMPEVGALCWVAQESTGRWGQFFILGFQAPVDEREDPETGEQEANFRANRQNLNPGDMMIRGRDENFIILRRGGVIQIGATAATQRLYIPIGNIIRDVCESYECFTLGGDMSWQVDRTDEDDAGQVNTRFRLRSKLNAGEPEHTVILTTGSHRDDENLRLSLVINESGETGAPTVVQLLIDKEGNVTWLVEKSFSLTASAVSIVAEKEDVLLEALAGKGTLRSKGDMLVQSISGSFTARGTTALMEASGVATIKGSTINHEGKNNLGGSAAKSPIVKGQELKLFLKALLQGIIIANDPASVMPPLGNPAMFAAAQTLLGQLDIFLSKNNNTS